MTTYSFGAMTLHRTGHLPADKAERKPDVIADYLPHSATGIISADPKVGKTWLALEAAVAIASGLPFLDKFDVTFGTVIIYSPEGSTFALDERITMICRRRGLERENLPLYIVIADKLHLDCKADQNSIREMVEELEPVFVLFDPLANCMEGQENINDDAKRVTNFVTSIANRYGTAVMIIHHKSKATGKSDGGGLRGASALFGFGTNYWFLLTDGGRLLLRQIQKNGKPLSDIPIKLVAGDGIAGIEIDGEMRLAPPRVELVDKIKHYMAHNGNNKQTLEAIRQAVGARYGNVASAIKYLAAAGEIKKQKTGGYKATKLLMGWLNSADYREKFIHPSAFCLRQKWEGWMIKGENG